MKANMRAPLAKRLKVEYLAEEWWLAMLLHPNLNGPPTRLVLQLDPDLTLKYGKRLRALVVAVRADFSRARSVGLRYPSARHTNKGHTFAFDSSCPLQAAAHLLSESRIETTSLEVEAKPALSPRHANPR